MEEQSVRFNDAHNEKHRVECSWISMDFDHLYHSLFSLYYEMDKHFFNFV